MPIDGKVTDTQVTLPRDWINQRAQWEGAVVGTRRLDQVVRNMGIPAEARRW